MIPILTKESLRQAQKKNDLDNTLPLVQQAGHQLTLFIKKKCTQYSTILVLLGPGNKGLDALCAVDLLSTQGYIIWILTTENVANFRQLSQRYKHNGNIKLIQKWEFHQFDLILDGLFGIGLNRGLTEPYSNWLRLSNQISTVKIAIDIPSGLMCDTGIAYSDTFQADHTYSLIAGKIGLYTADGPDYCGEIVEDDLNIAVLPDGFTLSKPITHFSWRTQQKNTHKGMFGNIGIIGGAKGMIGASFLTAEACLHSGAGRVWLSALDDSAENMAPLFNPQIMTKSLFELIDSKLDCLIIGPGTNASDFDERIIHSVINVPYPILLDAGFLPLLKDSQLIEQLSHRCQPTIITPHPGEAGQILNRKVISRVEDAKYLSQLLKAWVVLKGQGTVISSPEQRWWINTTGNSALSIPGSGDILCGVIGSLISRCTHLEFALLNAVNIHGQAAMDYQNQYCGTIGMSYRELLFYIRSNLNKL
ncbi:bifunctional NAD(P)H-hydrate repair enzyme Nnr [Ferrovum sp. JA12]|uniref:NAD(P)H-hydrate dehydratase n=1 Tax=Ferrovum sp. JA12 TaxID=1356299 RepID=UPI000703A802|nr:NAD(P)H-hydrate dehydratase [Ferrovum sp. JA12]KRH78740.1 bifunctional NAD(P)H-hydrate repair enzyme Nnr [Ferrovum sp. JA12]